MKTHFIPQPIKYDGTQLCSHWIYRNTGIPGDAMIAFTGPAEVKLDNMVDLTDQLEKRPIFSHNMLHFLAEFFHNDLNLTICYQRLLICTIKEGLEKLKVQQPIIRQGDDLFIEQDELRKLSVSIATLSPVSSLIHTAVNIESKETPVPTIGLNDLNLDPRKLSRSVLENFTQELTSMWIARAKVRGVA